MLWATWGGLHTRHWGFLEGAEDRGRLGGPVISTSRTVLASVNWG